MILTRRGIAIWPSVLGSVAALGGLYLASLHTYLLFHGLVELFSVVVACGIFMIAWNSRSFVRDGFVLLLGVGYLWVGALDLVHTLGYDGMGAIVGYDANMPTQLWVAARYLEAVTLCLAPLWVHQRVSGSLAMIAYAAVFVLVMLSIFTWGVFPDCFIEGQGLTSFKRVSEYVICGLFATAAALLILRWDRFDGKVLTLTVVSLGLSILAELSFTRYAQVYGPANMVGHFLKLLSFWVLYKAAIETSLTRPYSLLFQGLKQTEDALRESRDDLERQVDLRTAELRKALAQRDSELAERKTAESRLKRERARLYSLMQVLPGYVVLCTKDHRVRFANDKFLELFGAADSLPCHKLLRGRDEPCEPCPVQEVLESDGPVEWEWRSAKGRVYHVLGYPFWDADGTRLVLELGIDITEREELQAQVLESSEAERRRIGQDLHDSLGQTLSGLSCLSQVVHRKLASRGAAEAGDLARIESLLADSVVQTRSLAHGLNPIQMTGSGLLSALRQLAENTEALFGVRCTFQSADSLVLADDAKVMHLYRIAQEAIHNAARHASATRIDMSLAASNGDIVLTVTDDGVGFRSGSGSGNGMGLRVMRYRANQIGGSLSVREAEGGGTVVTCRADLRQTTETQ